MELETSLALLHGSSATPFPELQDQYKRKPFRHPALEGLAGVSAESKGQVLDKTRTAQLAKKYGLDTVLRWKPKMVCTTFFTLVYNVQRMELTFDILDGQPRRLRPTYRVIASFVRYHGGHCITEGGPGSGQYCAKAVLKALGARNSHSVDLKEYPKNKACKFFSMPGLRKFSESLRPSVHQNECSLFCKPQPLSLSRP